MKNEKTLLPNLGLAPFCKSRGMTLQIAQLQQYRYGTRSPVITRDEHLRAPPLQARLVTVRGVLTYSSTAVRVVHVFLRSYSKT